MIATMNKCLEILDKIALPLTFAAQDDYRCLPLMRDMEKTMKTLAERLRQEIALISFPEGQESGMLMAESLKNFDAIFTGFDQISLEAKVKGVATSLSLIQGIERIITHALPVHPAPEAGDNNDFPETNYARTCFERLALPVLSVKGVGAKTAALLGKKGLLKIEDLIYFLPRRYEDRRFPVNISQARVGVRETITGTVTQSEIKFYGKRPVFEATIEDGTGFLKAKWFK